MELPPSPGPAIERASMRWFAGVVSATLAVLGAVACFIVWVDPFQQYHLASRYPPRFYFLHHRYIDPGLAKNQAYDTVVSGSSIMENSRNDFVARVCGGAAVNLSMPAMSASEQRLMLETAFADRPLRRVIAVLDFNEFAGGVDERQDVAGPLPRYLYDRNPFNDLPYLLSWDVLVKAWRIVTGDASEKFTSDSNGAWFWGNVVRFGRDQVLRGLDVRHLNTRYQQPQRTLQGMRASFVHNLLPLLHDHPETEFDLVWPPYSILVWLDFAQRDQVQVSLDFKRYVFETTRRLANVHVIDLQGERAVTHDLDRYDDIYHFDPAINERLVEAACQGRNRVDASNIDEFEQQLREQVAAVNTPAGLAAVVGELPGATR
ncbi:MAG: hypothetical protein M3R31_01805 [Pseudomonadota bacterium]|nr:hypothetical protein [Pseudomonadota bacterium]